MKKILVVDDEKPISDIVKFNLVKEGYEVVTAFDGEEALELFESEKPDLIYLDLMLPKIDGLEVTRQIRKTSEVPILMVSAKDTEFDKVIGLELGADDYITKPFSNRELLARIKSNLRRMTNVPVEQPKDSKKELVIGNLRINPTHYAAYKNETQLDLTHREFELLYYISVKLSHVKHCLKLFGAMITSVMFVLLTSLFVVFAKKLKILQAALNTYLHVVVLDTI